MLIGLMATTRFVFGRVLLSAVIISARNKSPLCSSRPRARVYIFKIRAGVVSSAARTMTRGRRPRVILFWNGSTKRTERLRGTHAIALYLAAFPSLITPLRLSIGPPGRDRQTSSSPLGTESIRTTYGTYSAGGAGPVRRL